MSPIKSNLAKQEVAREIFNTLKTRIIKWDYLPGQRLTEEAISNEFGVSRIPVRDALRMLIDNGYVVKEAYKGYHVTNIDLRQIRELYELRLALELYAVAKATEKFRQEDWQSLFDYWGEIPDPVIEDADELTREDENFHLTIARQSDNKQLILILTQIFERLRVIRIYDFSSPERTVKTFQQHRRILECIREKQIQEAQAAITENILGSEDNVEKSVAHTLSQAYLKTIQT